MNREAGTRRNAAAIEAQRPSLLQFARLQVRDASTAEDLVHDTLLAALQKADAFSNRSSLRTWLIAILRHKIVDHFRREGREIPVDDLEDDVAAMFLVDGHFSETPTEWGNPEELLSQEQFFRTLESCVGDLPFMSRQAFLMRDMMGMDTAEIEAELDASPGHVFVLLHRARLRLRACLESRWFGAGGRR
jgi:RNA polymerase sigma-70 factor (TIGR02943 family)